MSRIRDVVVLAAVPQSLTPRPTPPSSDRARPTRPCSSLRVPARCPSGAPGSGAAADVQSIGTSAPTLERDGRISWRRRPEAIESSSVRCTMSPARRMWVPRPRALGRATISCRSQPRAPRAARNGHRWGGASTAGSSGSALCGPTRVGASAAPGSTSAITLPRDPKCHRVLSAGSPNGSSGRPGAQADPGGSACAPC